MLLRYQCNREEKRMIIVLGSTGKREERTVVQYNKLSKAAYSQSSVFCSTKVSALMHACAYILQLWPTTKKSASGISIV